MVDQFRLTRRGHLLTLIIGAAILGIIILVVISGVIQKWLWMQQLNYTVIFWTLLSVKWRMFCLAFVVAFLYLWINLRLAAKKGAVSREGNSPGLSDILLKSGIQISPAGLKLAMLKERKDNYAKQSQNTKRLQIAQPQRGNREGRRILLR